MVSYCLIKWVEWNEYLEWCNKESIVSLLDYFDYVLISKCFKKKKNINDKIIFDNCVNNFLK